MKYIEPILSTYADNILRIGTIISIIIKHKMQCNRLNRLIYTKYIKLFPYSGVHQSENNITKNKTIL